MKKKNLILIIACLSMLVIGYFGYKGFCLYYYNVNNINDETFNIISNGLNIQKTITLKASLNQENQYFEYNGIKIKNDFNGFEEVSQSTNETSPKLALKNEKGETKAAFWMGETNTYVDLLKNDKTLFGSDDNRVSNTMLSDFLQENNINNDIELFEFLHNYQNVKLNIFSSVKKMKDFYTIYFLSTIMLPSMENLSLINGDFEGYVFNMKSLREVSILKNDKRYVFTFMNNDYFTDAKIKELLETIIIK